MKRDVLKDEFLDELEYVEDRLFTAENEFNLTDDPDLIECFIYEILSLKSKHSYLIKTAKRNGIKANPYERTPIPDFYRI